MRAQKVLLTHFSARYPGMPPRQGEASGGPLVGFAFDYARIRLGDMWKLNMYLPAINHTFDEIGEEEPMEIVAIMMILGMQCIPRISININLDA